MKRFTLTNTNKFIEHYLPLCLPVLLIFSRSLADITVLLLGLGFLYRSYRLQSWEWSESWWFRLSLLFWFYLLFINTPYSINLTDSLLHAIFYLRWPLFAAALAYWLLADHMSKKRFLIALLPIILFVIVDTSLQYFMGTDLFGHQKASPTRLTGPYSRPIPGIMMLRVLFISMFIVFVLRQLSKPLHQVVCILSLLCIGLLFIFITGERMALILFTTGEIVILLGLLLQYKHYRTRIYGGMMIIFGCCLALILLAPDTAERSIFSIYHKLTHFIASDYGMVFRAAYAAWQQYPIIGSGFHTYKLVCNEIGMLAQWGIQCSHPHNLYLQIAAETGLIGLSLFTLSIASIYYTALHHLLKTRQWVMVSLSFVVLSVCFWPLIGGISILNNGVAALVWLGVGWVLSMRHASNTQYE